MISTAKLFSPGSWRWRADDERPAPRWAIVLLIGGLLVQLLWGMQRPPPRAQAEDLPIPPPIALLRGAALGDPIPLAKGLMLWLQGFDNQPGVSIPFASLDYGRVAAWLDRILALDRRGQYPLMAAVHLYGGILIDPQRKRQMLEWAVRQFSDDPDRRWRWTAFASIIARNSLHDLPLALSYAHLLAAQPPERPIPGWARQMEMLLLADMGEVERAQILLGAMLDSGQVTDPKELHFLLERQEAWQTQPTEESAHSPSPME